MADVYRVLDGLRQGTAEWLAVRRTHVTGTEVAHIWSGRETFEHLRALKRGEIEAPDLSNVPSIREGRLFEPKVREYIRTRYRALLCPRTGKIPTPCLESVEEPYFMVSLDGLTEAGFPVEIKTTYSGSSNFNDVKANGPLSKEGRRLGYIAQIQWEVFLTGAKGAVFFGTQSPDGKQLGEIVMQYVPRDDGIIAELVSIGKAFKAFMTTGTMPVNLSFNGRVIGGDPSSPDFQRKLEDYRALDKEYGEEKAKLDALKDKRAEMVKELCEGYLQQDVNSFCGEGFSLQRSVREGSYDSKKLVDFLLEKHLLTEEQLAAFKRRDSVSYSVRLKD